MSCALDLDHRHRVAAGHRGPAFGNEPNEIADSQVLPFRMDLVGAVNVQADRILDGVIAIQATAVLTDLDQPLPHGFRRCMNVHSTGDQVSRARNQFIARKHRGLIGLAGAPVTKPMP
jgi:hypothetical protein